MKRDVNYWLKPENRLIDQESVDLMLKSSRSFQRWVKRLYYQDSKDALSAADLNKVSIDPKYRGILNRMWNDLRHYFQDEDDSGWVFNVFLVERLLNGKVIPHAEAVEILQAFNVEIYLPKVDALADALAAGDITIGAWQSKMAALIKEQHIVSAIAGKGSRDLMTFADWGRTGGRLGFQYAKLDRFAYQIATGQFSPAYIKARARMYANAQRIAYWDTLTQSHIESGNFTEEARFLGHAEHCEDCIYYENLSWQPLGTLPEPGEGAACLSNCQCGKEYR